MLSIIYNIYYKYIYIKYPEEDPDSLVDSIPGVLPEVIYEYSQVWPKN